MNKDKSNDRKIKDLAKKDLIDLIEKKKNMKQLKSFLLPKDEDITKMRS